jgi:hypothetical protein
MADAWDAQADIEACSVDGIPCVGALLDYEKFFDLFHPDIARVLFLGAGLPPNLVEQLCHLYTTLKRYVKVAGGFGAVIPQANGCPQGDSLSPLSSTSSSRDTLLPRWAPSSTTATLGSRAPWS